MDIVVTDKSRLSEQQDVDFDVSRSQTESLAQPVLLRQNLLRVHFEKQKGQTTSFCYFFCAQKQLDHLNL